eukprot:Lankesteria_metandrocarpae@DN4476_c0_g1_i1.p1
MLAQLLWWPGVMVVEEWQLGTATRASLDNFAVMFERRNQTLHYQPELPLALHCHASTTTIAALLTFKQDGKPVVISTLSKTLYENETGWPIWEKEACPIVCRLEAYSPYTMGITTTSL